MKIIIGSDHAGFIYKEKIKKWLSKKGYIVEDVGPFEYKKDDDYPIYTIPLAEKVAKTKGSMGIIVALTGIGEVIAANKVKGIRAVSFTGKANKDFLEKSRIHDNTNVLCFGSKFVTLAEAKRAIFIWLKTDFSNETRHKRRLKEISNYERKHWKN
jgi:ribose 5-phosphate isomerase B